MARKKKVESGASGAPAWMSTYGDMVTLLLCFFVLLYAFSSLDTQKFISMAESFQRAFNVQPGGGQPVAGPSLGGDNMMPSVPGEVDEPTDSDQTERARQVLALVQEAIKAENLEDEVKVSVAERGVVVSFSEQFLFSEGSARIHPEALRILYKIGQIIETIPNKVDVEGHTDSNQPLNSIYGDNWGLSSARAASVTSYLNNELGIDAARLKAVGLASISPQVPNDTEQHMILNRRVELVILSLHEIH
jgi:chemotaxis protein MotB